MQLRGFGMTMDFERGTMRSWFFGDDGVKRWADNSAPVIPGPNCDRSACGDFSPSDCEARTDRPHNLK